MNTRRPTLILSFMLLVVMLGYGMVLPVIPFYIQQLGAGGRELGWLMASYALMQLLCAPLWGALSDRIGRKPVLSIGVLGYALSMLLFGLANSFWMLWMVMGGVLIFVQGGLTKPLTTQFGEFRLMVAGLAGGALGFVGLSLAVDEPTTLLAVGLLSVALALIDPALSSSISSVGGARQGTLMGLNSASASLGLAGRGASQQLNPA